jgi:hypothetical protein
MKDIIDRIEKQRDEAHTYAKSAENRIAKLEVELRDVRTNLSHWLGVQSQCNVAIELLKRGG